MTDQWNVYAYFRNLIGRQSTPIVNSPSDILEAGTSQRDQTYESKVKTEPAPSHTQTETQNLFSQEFSPHRKSVKIERLDEVEETKIKTEPTRGVKRAANNESPDVQNAADTNQNYPMPAPGVRRSIVLEPSILEKTLENYKDGPVCGLDYVIEIHKIDSKVVFYCRLCDSQCASRVIVEHLAGLRHGIKCLEISNPGAYDGHKYNTNKEKHQVVKEYLTNEERVKGRGRVKVEKEYFVQITDNDNTSQDLRKRRKIEETQGSLEEELHRSIVKQETDKYMEKTLNSFKCVLCDVIVHSQAVWNEHVTGNRHMKNKKSGGGANKKNKSSPLINTEARLVKYLKNIKEPVVGLEYLRETQFPNLQKYFCYICQSSLGQDKVIKHLLGVKHRIEYLDFCNKNGKPNNLDSFRMLPAIEKLLQKECGEHIKKFGTGRIKVYKSEEH